MEKDTRKQPVKGAAAPEYWPVERDKKEAKVFSDTLSEQWSADKVREAESPLEKHVVFWADISIRCSLQ